MGIYTNLQRGILPNIYPLKPLIKWFDAVSDFLDGFPTTPQVVAMANIDASGTVLKSSGFTAPVLHPGTGQYALNLTITTYNINDLIPFANVTNVGTPGGAINIYPSMSTGSQVFLNLWQIAVTTAARTAVDQEFMVMILKKP
jgi:hypothetical protein